MTQSHPPRLLRTHAILLWERAYAAFMPVLAICGLWAGTSLLGVWAAVPSWAHLAGLIFTLGGLGWVLINGIRRFSWSRRAEAQARLEGDANLPPGTLRDLADTPFGDDQDNPFWQAHQSQLAAQAAGATPHRPRATIDQTDPLFMRFAALLLVGMGILVAGDQSALRLSQSLAPQWGDPDRVIADVWIDPPAYTRAPARFLVRAEALPNATVPAQTVPAGSVLHARLTRRDGRPVRVRATLATAQGQRRLPPPDGQGAVTLTQRLDENLALSLKAGGRDAIWPIEVSPDLPPVVNWNMPLEEEGGTRTVIGVDVDDDYGVEDATLFIRLVPPLDRAPDAPALASELSETVLELKVPTLRGNPGRRQVALDLTEHPWAGLPVSIVVQVTDGAGQAAQTEPQLFTLPERTFYNPLAQTVIEERRNMALAPGSWRRTARMFDALTFAPDRFAANSGEYLLLRTAYHDVYHGQGTNSATLVESLWPLAMALEDEGLTLARQRLEAAQQALRDALARNAPQAEIDQLIEELRVAMDDYIAALAASGDAMAGDSSASSDMNQRDLDDILDEIAQLRRQGDSAEARARLAELERLLENLQISQGGSGGEGQPGQGQGGEGNGSADGEGDGDGEGGRPLDRVGDLIDQQRRLSDDTFGAQRGDRSSAGLADDQSALSDTAQALAQEALAQEAQPQDATNGAEGAEGAAAFNRAADLMDQAAGALARGELYRAQTLQEQAQGALRDGAGALAAQALAEDGENADGETATRPGRDGTMTGAGAERDPLGRLYGSQGDTGIEIPDLSSPERIRELTDTLRQRLADPQISPAERAYLERLLERF